MRPPARLLLEDGTVFCGRQVGTDEGMRSAKWCSTWR